MSFDRAYAAAILIAGFMLLPAVPAFAAGEILISHSKALAGNVTSGDTTGYPVTLTQSGAYELSGNLAVPAGKTGIVVAADDITIDLNGFRLSGGGTAYYGFTGTNGIDAVTIQNGTIRNFRYDGIIAKGNYWIVENMRSIENGRDGIVVGARAIVRSSVSSYNGRNGLLTGQSAVIQGNTVSDNGGFGISTHRSTVNGNAINSNYLVGLSGGATSGYSGNTLFFNNSSGEQAEFMLPQHPNACSGACP